MPGNSPITRDRLLRKISGKDGIFCLLTDKIDHEVLEKAGSKIPDVLICMMIRKIL